MDKIRVNSGIVVEVNDKGETIVINAEDQNFIEKFYGLLEKLEEMKKRAGASELKEKSEREQHQYAISETKNLMADIDNVFGENACKKIFGDIVPSPYLIMTFFEQIVPITRQYANERQKKIAEKYNRSRKGGKRNKHRNREEIIQDAMR